MLYAVPDTPSCVNPHIQHVCTYVTHLERSHPEGIQLVRPQTIDLHTDTQLTPSSSPAHAHIARPYDRVLGGARQPAAPARCLQETFNGLLTDVHSWAGSLPWLDISTSYPCTGPSAGSSHVSLCARCEGDAREVQVGCMGDAREVQGRYTGEI